MDEHFLFLLYLLRLLLFMGLATKVLFPFLRSILLLYSLRHFNDVFKSIDALAHLSVELLLDRVHVEVHILTETSRKRQGLLNSSFEVQISVQLYRMYYALCFYLLITRNPLVGFSCAALGNFATNSCGTVSLYAMLADLWIFFSEAVYSIIITLASACSVLSS